MITGFNEVFESKLNKLRSRLKTMLSNAGRKKDRQSIKSLIKEAKGLRDTLRKTKSVNKVHTCPKCGHDF